MIQTGSIDGTEHDGAQAFVAGLARHLSQKALARTLTLMVGLAKNLSQKETLTDSC